MCMMYVSIYLNSCRFLKLYGQVQKKLNNGLIVPGGSKKKEGRKEGRILLFILSLC